MRPVFLVLTQSRIEHMSLGIIAGTIALYGGIAWLLPHFGWLSLPATLLGCLTCGLAFGLHLACHTND